MMIGIFWYFENKIIGIAHDSNQSDQDSLGLIDSSYTHVKFWETLKQNSLNLQEFEYEEIPRGRVIYNFKTRKIYVYMDAKLFKKSIAKQISEFFNLDFDSVLWMKDPHYKT